MRDAGPDIAVDASADAEPSPELDASPYITEEAGAGGGGVTPPVDDEDAGPSQPHPTASAGAGGSIAADGGTGGTAPSPPARSCEQGSEQGGYCWFLGASGASCNDVCQGHGGYDPALSWVGTTAQGGAFERCDQLLTMLTSPGTTTAGRRTDGRGLGCHLYQDQRWWLNEPDFDPAAKYINARVVCSCTDHGM